MAFVKKLKLKKLGRRFGQRLGLISADVGPPWPKDTKGVDQARLPELANRFMRRRGSHDNIKDFLPPRNADLGVLFHQMTEPADDAAPKGKRSDIRINNARLANEFAGQPQILFYHAMSISYLRRVSPHTTHARQIFFRMWTEHGAELLPLLSNRWLISALQTFHDHGQTAEQRRIGSVGWVYANLIKFVEMERSFSGLDADTVYPGQTLLRPLGMEALGATPLGATDAMLNTNSLIYELAFLDPVAGPVLEELLVRVSQSKTMFHRMDATRASLGIEYERFRNSWCFAKPYPKSDRSA